MNNRSFRNVFTIVFLALFAVGILLPAEISAEPTQVVVRARAKNAKFIGTSIGGAMVMILNASTGEILANGITKGSTGNTDLIMRTPHKRFDNIAEGAAKFEANIDIDEPTFITVKVMSPYIKKQATVSAQTQVWLIPGKPIDGEGIVIEIPGFIVDVLSPRTHSFNSEDKLPLNIKANVVMMCGCPVESGGLWDADNYQVGAFIKRNDEFLEKVKLDATELNTFEASYSPEEPGVYEITVYAYDPQTGNTGVDKTTAIVN